MLRIDLQNAIEDPRSDNFTVLLFRLLFKSDANNREKLRIIFPVEVMMVYLYQRCCIFKEGTKEPDYKVIEERALELIRKRV